MRSNASDAHVRSVGNSNYNGALAHESVALPVRRPEFHPGIGEEEPEARMTPMPNGIVRA